LSSRAVLAYGKECTVSQECQDENKAQPGSGSATGKSVQPDTQLPCEEEPTKVSDVAVEEISIGSPVSPEDVKKLKERADQADKEESPEASEDEG
jgi:uncharacterized spore protein YtfJ